MSDYLELPLDHDDTTRIDLWIHPVDRTTPIVLKDVRAPVRSQGFWHIGYQLVDSVDATAMIPADTVAWFTVIEHPRDNGTAPVSK